MKAKVRVLKTFIHDNTPHHSGNVVDLPESLVKELSTNGVVAEVKEPFTTKEEKRVKK